MKNHQKYSKELNNHPKIKNKKFKFQKQHKQLQNWLEIGLYVSYRAQNLHAEIFLRVIWSLDRSKVPKVSKNHDFDDFLKGQKGGKNGDNPHCDNPIKHD